MHSRAVKYIKMILFFIFILSYNNMLCVADQDTEDIFASVVVLPEFDISVDNNFIDFGLVEPGQSATLKEGAYYNAAKCVSNKGITYYVKISIIGDIIGPQGTKLEPSIFKWKVYDTNGEGTAITEWRDFSDRPVMVYSSALEDEKGAEVNLRFQYRLDLPPKALGGNYSFRVAYSITEEE